MAEDEQTLHQLEEDTLSTIECMGFVLNQDKSATNSDTLDLITKRIDYPQAYKYLGIWEEKNEKTSPQNKEAIKNKMLNRVESLCKTKLIAKHLSKAINEFALATTNYVIGIVDYDLKEFDNLDKNVRRCLYENEALRASSNIERLYLPRKKQGRGISCLADKTEVIQFKLSKYLEGGERGEITKAEEQAASILSIIQELLKTKYRLQVDFTIEQLKQAQEEEKMESINKKVAHRVQFMQDDNGHIDFELSAAWLCHGYVTPSQEATFTKLQDRNTQGKVSNVCGAIRPSGPWHT